MSLRITAEQRMLQEGLQQLLSEAGTADSGSQQRQWRQLADEIGVVGLCVPTEFDGAGGTFADLATTMEAMGRALYAGPYLSSAVLCAHALLLSGDPAAQAAHLPDLARGQRLGAVIAAGLCEIGDRFTAHSGHERTTLSGTASAVLDGAGADLLVVAADDGTAQSLFTVDASATGVQRTALTSLDLRRSAAEVVLSKAPAQRLGPTGAGAEILPRLHLIAGLAVAAEQAGGASRCLDDAREYATVRYQFGRPIGSFQAVQHTCADMYQQVRSGHVAVRHAARCLDTDSSEVPEAVALAKVYCSEAYLACSSANLQIHGGMGFTWEADCHLHYRRARASAPWAGSPTELRQRLADRLLAG